MTEIQRKAWKLVEALAEDCDSPKVIGDDHNWRECRRCHAVAELQSEESKELMRALIAERGR